MGSLAGGQRVISVHGEARCLLRDLPATVHAHTTAGGKAVAAVCSAEEGEQIVKAGLDAFGAVHVLVANAGILRDKSFMGMDEKMWDQVISVHLRGTYRVCRFPPQAVQQVDVQLVDGRFRPNVVSPLDPVCRGGNGPAKQVRVRVKGEDGRDRCPRRGLRTSPSRADRAVLQSCLAAFPEAEVWPHHHYRLAERSL